MTFGGDPGETPDDVVQSFVRGLSVIRAFDVDHARLTLSDVALQTGLPRAAARRFLRTLVHLGYVATDDRVYALTPRILDLGYSYLSALSIPEIAQPHLERLSREVDESVSAAVLDGAVVVYIARVPTRRIINVRITIGTRFPAYATAMGRVLLASLPEAQLDAALAATELRALTPSTITEVSELRRELERVRAQGWALVDGELELGLRSLAAPLRDRFGTTIAAINISAARIEPDPSRFVDANRRLLLETAGAIGDDLQRR